MLPTQNVGIHLQYGTLCSDVERKNRPGGKIDASEEKGCQKEKALTSDGETESR